MPVSRAALAEFVGTFALMFIGGGAIIVTGGENLVAIALAHGLILAVMVTATMHISGGQINPAVSVALGIIGKQPWSRVATFVAAQLAGATAAAFLLKVLLSTSYDVGNIGATLGSLTMADSGAVSPGRAIGLEIIATFFLMFVIMGSAVDERGVGAVKVTSGLAIGLTVTAAILCLGPLTGASLNPARSLGPALVAGAWDYHWVYWVGPMTGAVLAAVVYTVSFRTRSPEPAGGPSPS
ncbi:MAG: aquaporin [Planctomycetota bacterium]|nr:MAG: aquaporin [Planctomycetota bacterium]